MNSDFIIENGVLKKYIGNEKDVIIPDEVTEIGAKAFSVKRFTETNLKTVTINHSIRKIGYKAFERCGCLTAVNIKGTVDVIDTLAFSWLPNLKKFEVKTSPKRIGDRAFSFCSNFRPETTKLLDSPRKVGINAFEGTGCEHIIIKSNKTRLKKNKEVSTQWGRSAFMGCRKLKTVEFSGSADFVSESMFEGCDMLTTVIFNREIDEIMPRAFKSCKALKRIDLGRVKCLGAEAFENCTALEEITFPRHCDHFYIGRAGFYGCSALRDVELPEGMLYLSFDVFACCIRLKSVIISETIDTIFPGAFRDCISLEKVVCKVPKVRIREDTFQGCERLKSIPDNMEVYNESEE